MEVKRSLQAIATSNLAAALVLVACGAALAQGTLEIIPLKHRTVEQVLPTLSPLLEPGGALSGQANRLIVRTSPGNLAEIRRVLEAIDTPPRRLLISVRFETEAEASRRAPEARGTLRSGDAAITTAPVPADRTQLELRLRDSRNTLGERVDQQVQVIEGGRAFIASGESRPLRQRQLIQTPAGQVTTEAAVQQDFTTGFDVVPRLSGHTAILEIAPRREAVGSVAHGAVLVQRAATTVSARLGEWVELGGMDGASTREGSGLLASREARAAQSRRIWLKVEEIRH